MTTEINNKDLQTEKPKKSIARKCSIFAASLVEILLLIALSAVKGEPGRSVFQFDLIFKYSLVSVGPIIVNYFLAVWMKKKYSQRILMSGAIFYSLLFLLFFLWELSDSHIIDGALLTAGGVLSPPIFLLFWIAALIYKNKGNILGS